MDSTEYTEGLVGLRGVRDDIKGLRRELEQLDVDLLSSYNILSLLT